MSNIGGNYNFGVWNPPTGIDSIRYSQNINTDLINESNNLRLSKEEGFKQDYGVTSLKFESPDINLINYLNDNNLKVFTGMIRQGWGGFSQNFLPVIDGGNNGYPSNPITPIDIYSDYDIGTPIEFPNIFFLK